MPKDTKTSTKQRIIRGLMLCTLLLSQTAQTYVAYSEASNVSNATQVDLNKAAGNLENAMAVAEGKKREDEEKAKEESALNSENEHPSGDGGDGSPPSGDPSSTEIETPLVIPRWSSEILDFQGFDKHLISASNAEIIGQDLGQKLGFVEGMGSIERPFVLDSLDQLKLINQIENGWQNQLFSVVLSEDTVGNQTSFEGHINDFKTLAGGSFHYILSAGIYNFEQNNTWSPIGNTSGEFTGHFDGNGQTINNLQGQGLFNIIAKNASVKNLTIQNAEISTTRDRLGILAHYNNGHIENVSVGGRVSGGNYESIGGLVGGNNEGQITRCHVLSGTSVSGSAFVGGLAGFSEVGSSISESSSAASVSGNHSIGGLVGEWTGANGTSIEKSWATGEVNGIYWVGGLVGRAVNSNSRLIETYATGKVTEPILKLAVLSVKLLLQSCVPMPLVMLKILVFRQPILGELHLLISDVTRVDSLE